MTRTKNRIASVCWTLPLLNILLGTGLCLLHVHVEAADRENNNDGNADPQLHAWSRIASGPLQWSAMDKVLFLALIMLALEALNFLCGQSGGTLFYVIT